MNAIASTTTYAKDLDVLYGLAEENQRKQIKEFVIKEKGGFKDGLLEIDIGREIFRESYDKLFESLSEAVGNKIVDDAVSSVTTRKQAGILDVETSQKFLRYYNSKSFGYQLGVVAKVLENI